MTKVFFYIDREKCINCSICFLICKKCFRIENNIVKENTSFLNDDEDIEKLKLASKSCPTNAIYLDIFEEENIIK